MISKSAANTPVFTNPFSEARQYILDRFLIGAIVLYLFRLLGIISSTIINGYDPSDWFGAALLVSVLVGLVSVRVNKQWNYQIRASILLIAIFVFGIQNIMLERLVVGAGQLALIAFVILAFVLLGTRTGVIASGLSLVTIWIVSYLSNGVDNSGIANFYTGVPGFLVPIVIFIIVAAAITIAIGRLLAGIQDAVQQEQELAQTLESEKRILQNRITARAQALQTSTEINRQLSQLLDEKDIIQATIDQIGATFETTNVQLYKLDQQAGDLKLQGASGDGGETLLSENIRLTIGFGSIGKAAVSQEIVTMTEPDHSQPHVLPETEIMLAVPILYEQSLYGILLIQHHNADRVDEDMRYSLKLIADQVAIALQNAQQYKRAQKLLLHEELVNEIRLKIQNTDSIEEVLQTAAHELGRALDAQQTYLKIGRENQLKL